MNFKGSSLDIMTVKPCTPDLNGASVIEASAALREPWVDPQRTRYAITPSSSTKHLTADDAEGTGASRT